MAEHEIVVVLIRPPLYLSSISAVVYCCACMPPRVNLLLMPFRVFSGGGDAVIKCWDIQTGDNKLTLQGHTEEVVRLFLFDWCC